MKKHFCIVTLESGKIITQTPFVKMLWELQDGKYIIEIAAHNKRSNLQNRYYWGLVVPMIQQGIRDMGTEITKEECHEFLKSRFNYEEIVNTESGECVQIPRSTTALSKEQFSEYVGKIQQFSAEFLNVVIPDAGVQTAIEY